MKKDFTKYQKEAYLEINLLEDWLDEAKKLLKDNLLCVGKKDDLQWFGTNLIQKVGEEKNAEISSIYGKLAETYDDFCYQLCHSKPWGFEMGRNPNAVMDVLRGDSESDVSKDSYLIWYDADVMYEKAYEGFKTIFEIFLECAKEFEEQGRVFRVILLFDIEKNIPTRKLCKHKERFAIKTIKTVRKEV